MCRKFPEIGDVIVDVLGWNTVIILRVDAPDSDWYEHTVTTASETGRVERWSLTKKTWRKLSRGLV